MLPAGGRRHRHTQQGRGVPTSWGTRVSLTLSPRFTLLPESMLPDEFPRKQKIMFKTQIFKTQPEATTEKFWLRRNAVRNK